MTLVWEITDGKKKKKGKEDCHQNRKRKMRKKI